MSQRSRFTQFTNAQWERVKPLLPTNEGRKGRPFGDSRRVVEGIIYRYRTWDRVFAHILAEADAVGDIDWNVSIDATINRAHQHGTNLPRPDQDTGGSIELQESAVMRD